MQAGVRADREPQALIERPRLAGRCAQSSVIVLEAPGGFGKSTLAEQLAQGATTIVRLFLTKEDSSPHRLVTRLRDGCRTSNLVAAVEAGSGDATPSEQVAAIAAAMARAVPDGGWVIVENAHFLSGDAARLIGALVLDLRSAHHVDPRLGSDGGGDGVSMVGWRGVVAGRVVATTIDGELRLGADDLVFRIEETETLIERTMVADDELAHVITRDCAGWPAAIGLSIAAQARGQSVLAAPLRLDTLISGLLENDDRLSPGMLALLGHLPVVSDAIGDALGMPNLVDAIVASGLPIRMTGSWGRLPDPVREHLATIGQPSDQDLVTALEVVFAGGETTMAVDMLLAANRPSDVCRLIADIPYRQLDRIDVDEIAALLNAVPTDAVIQNPRCLAQLARAAEGRVRIALRTRLLERLADIVRVLDDPVMTRELEAELICDLDRDSLIDEADARGRALLESTPAHELITRARCLRALGRANAWRGDARSLVDASHLLAEAAGAARTISNDVWVSDSLCTLGYYVHFVQGDFELAVTKMREGIDLLGRRSRRRAVQLTFLAEVQALLGRDDDAIASLGEARSIARIHADERILGYAAWTQARVVARRRDVDGTLRWLAEAERHPGDWLDHPTGTQFLAEAAEISAMVGAERIAESFLARATAQAEAQGLPQITEAATGALAARFGDPALAELLLGLDRTDAYLNASNMWRTSILIAHARSRRGDADGARSMATSVVEQLEALGHPEFAMLHEPDIWPALVRLLEGNGAPTVAISLLGGFGIEIDGAEITLPAGRPAQVVKVLALAGRPIPVDELIEILWPDTPTDVGRRRLRNVLARVRSAGPLLDRSEGVLALVPTAVVDSQRFERLAREASTAAADLQLSAAEHALEVYTGELLPGDRFEEWTVAPRERMQRRAIRLLGQIVDGASDRGDVDRAMHAADQLLQLDPFDDSTARRIAAMLLAAGRSAEAADWFKRADDIRRDLGLPLLD